jgi:hypothetical protein
VGDTRERDETATKGGFVIDFNSLPDVVAVVGSREFPKRKLEWVTKFVNNLLPETIVVSGGARGVDTAAEEAAVQRKDLHFYPYRVPSFLWEKKGKGVGHFRNQQLVEFVNEYGGVVVVFHCVDENGVMTGGSMNVVRNCLKLKVPYILISEHGVIGGTKK